MADLSVDLAEIELLMKALNLLDERRAELSTDERDLSDRLAFKLGTAAAEIWKPLSK